MRSLPEVAGLSCSPIQIFQVDPLSTNDRNLRGSWFSWRSKAILQTHYAPLDANDCARDTSERACASLDNVAFLKNEPRAVHSGLLHRMRP